MEESIEGQGIKNNLVKHILNKAGYRYRKAKNYRGWFVADCKKVVFIYESKVCIDEANGTK